MTRALETASTRIEGRPTGSLVADRGMNSCYPSPSWFLSAAPQGGSCGGMNLEAIEPRAPERRPGNSGNCAERYRSRLPRTLGRSFRTAARKRTGNGPCRQGG